MINKLSLVVGVPQSGKTFFSFQVAKNRTKTGFVFVYNAGRVTDWPGALEAIPVTPESMSDSHKEIRKIKDTYFEVSNFIIGGKTYTAKEIPIKFKGKILYCFITEYEKELFKTFFSYFHSGLIILDDFRQSTRYGLKDYHIQIFSRQNHTGLKSGATVNGVDILCIFHNITHPPPSLYDYVTDIYIFKLNSLPKLTLGDEDLESRIFSVSEIVNKSPRYSFGKISIGNQQRKNTYYIHS